MAKSLSEFRKDLFVDFNTMRDSGAVFEVYHRRKVYLISVESTDKKINKPYNRKVVTINPLKISTQECEQCQGLLVNGLCLNKKCPTNQKSGLL